VSSASTANIKNKSSLSNVTIARLVTGALASGVSASRRLFSCFSDWNFKRILAFALTATKYPLLKSGVQSNKQNLRFISAIDFGILNPEQDPKEDGEGTQ
jgi:hypothetical protein